MKIMCIAANSAPHFIRSGWGRVFKACGHDFRFWNTQVKSAHDAFAEFEPDIFLGTTYEVDRAVAKCIAARPEMKVALFASAWGEKVDSLDRKTYPLVYATEVEKGIIASLKHATGKPDFVFIHVTNKNVEGCLGGWRSIGVKPVGILNAADTFVYHKSNPRPELVCDAGYVGNLWPYKGKNIERFILPLCRPDSHLKVKIFGSAPWPVAQYQGVLALDEERALYNSAKVCLSVSEPHSTSLGFDVVERNFKASACGGLVLSDSVAELEELYNQEEIQTAITPEAYEDKLNFFLEHPIERAFIAENGWRKTLKEHTYFHRVAKMCVALGLSGEGRAVMERHHELVLVPNHLADVVDFEEGDDFDEIDRYIYQLEESEAE